MVKTLKDESSLLQGIQDREYDNFRTQTEVKNRQTRECQCYLLLSGNAENLSCLFEVSVIKISIMTFRFSFSR